MKKQKLVLLILYVALFLLGIKALFHGFPDIERFFAEWMDERLSLTVIMKFGTLNFKPTVIWHPPLYHYLTFIPIASFFVFGKLIGFFHDKVEFVRFYFNNTQYFFLIGRTMSYLFYWLTAVVVFKIARLFYSRIVAHVTALSYLLIPRFIFDFSTTRPETLLFLSTSIFFYFIFKYYLKSTETKYLFLAAFFLGVSTAAKYNALLLGSIFLPVLFYSRQTMFQRKRLIMACLNICLFSFLGFFICDPFFILQFNKYFYNFLMYNREASYYWHIPAIFGFTHLRELMSDGYLNLFGFLILIFGGWNIWKKDKKLFIIVFFSMLVYEIYFGIVQSNVSPLRYLNPLLAVAALIFSSGINFIKEHKRALALVPVMFIALISYNYFGIWREFSFGSTYLQRARYFIEQSIPEFTTICITSKSHLPQLNMTRESYYHLIDTAPVRENKPGHEFYYKPMDKEENHDTIFRELRIESLMKKPQYNLLRWNKNIKTEEGAINFLKKNNVEYILGRDIPMIFNKRLIDAGITSLVREFKSEKRRMFGNAHLYLYKVK